MDGKVSSSVAPSCAPSPPPTPSVAARFSVLFAGSKPKNSGGGFGNVSVYGLFESDGLVCSLGGKAPPEELGTDLSFGPAI
ncbi:d1a38ef9-185e-4121-b60e-916c829937e2 [Thermothielavioides terrestris]|uniref:D1a38ef9-185e-4121-b60e-916c829937e2 n=1 Tax=Thermothielavioides terrestris TaxID=2587410 RepID=A0A446B9J7_9PEZI|nr:d1a38ef9-185e-4121-b60e-916c829937e2 [Thermothielavioides terrestris]